MKTIKIFTISILVTLSMNLSAQIKVNSSGYIGINNTTPSYHFQQGPMNTTNSRSTVLGAQLYLGNYNTSWNTAFIQARNNTSQKYGIRFRTQNYGSLVDVFQIFGDGHIDFWKPVFFYDGHSNVSSDMRLKKDIKQLDKLKTNKLYSLQGKEYTRIYKVVDSVEISSPKETKEYGLLAQEVKQIYPELVSLNEDGYYAIKYTALIPIMIEAMKEQQEEIDKLKSSSGKLKSASVDSDFLDNTLETDAVLYQNTPNPFSENTKIKYFLPEDVKSATLYIYNMQGNQIKSIALYNRGEANETIYGSELQAGMYIYALIADGKEIDSKRMILTD